MATTATLTAIGVIASTVASAATVATTVAGTIKQSQAQDEQLKLQKKQMKDEQQSIQQAAALARKQAGAGYTGTILAPSGLGGQSATSIGRSTLLGG